MSQAVQRFAQEYYPYPTRIGLHVGHMVIGNVGGSSRYTLAASGNTVIAAFRTESLNKYLGTHLLAAAGVVGGLEQVLLLRRLGAFLLKGKQMPLMIFEILGQQGTSDNRQQLCRRFETALKVFERSDWQQAKRLFQALQTDYPQDGPSHFYVAICEHYCSSPPTDCSPIIYMENK